ncbi:O-antigen ligase family protein [Alteromonas sp. ALT199]|uniref:O-antigen ligase family protein n=1 Tax=unclassified Alteromonas TaxID=2614992 RepID=UPI001BEBE97B|nr:O-antigen ligase family protein [Alteromonas sp. ALT199]MBT3137049.1 O-antigen ligase family protein [Alteromonas sp. ALT199]
MFNTQKTEKFLFGFLLFTLFWLPLSLGANRPWAWALMQMSVFFLGGILLLTHESLLSKLYNQYKLLVIVWLVFLTWQLINIVPLPFSLVEALRPERINFLLNENAQSMESLSSQWLPLSFDVGQSDVIFFKSLAYCFLFFITLTLVNTGKRLRYILIVVSAAGVFQAIYGSLEVLSGLQYSLVFKLPVSHIATGSFVYKNHYANFLLLCLSAAIGYMIASLRVRSGSSPRERLRRIVRFWLSNKVLFRIGIIIMVIALVMSRSRMGNSAFFIAMTITATLGLIYFKPRQKSYVVLFISMLVIDILIVSSLFGLKQVQQRIEQTNLTQESRDEVVTDALPLLSQYGVIGTGGGTFYTVYPQVQSESIQHFYDHAHNEYLQFAIEFGIVGAAIIAMLVLLCAKSALSAMQNRRHPLPRGTAFAAVMAVIGMALHSTVDFPLQAPANTAIFIILLALGALSRDIPMGRQDK